MPLIDFKAVRMRIPIAKVLSILNYVPTSISQKSYYGRCPLGRCHPRDKRFTRRCASFDAELDVWYCHSCKEGGNQLELYADVKDLTLYEAAIELCLLCEIEIPVLQDIGPNYDPR